MPKKQVSEDRIKRETLSYNFNGRGLFLSLELYCLHCIEVYCIVLYGTILYFIVLYCIANIIKLC